MPEARRAADGRNAERWRAAGIAVALVAAVLVTYLPVADHAFIDWDDGPYIKQNPHVQRGLTLAGLRWAATAFHMGNWHPLTWLSHMLDCELFGLDAGAHHLVGAALHGVTAALLFLALRRMTRAPWAAAAVAALFALHPLRVESVAWAAERKDVLAGLCWMATLLAWAGYAERGGARRYAAVVLTLALGLLAKPMAVTLPLVLLLLDAWPLGRWRRGAVGRLVAEKLPLVALAAVAAWVAVLAQRAAGAVATLEALPITARLSNALVSYVAYLRMLVWPSGLAFYYPHPALVEGSGRDLAAAVAAALLLGGVTALALALGRRAPWVAVGWLWYLVTLVPVIGIVQLGMQARADRYTYLPSVGIALAVVWSAASRAARKPASRRALAALGLVVAVACAVATRAQLAHWKDNRALAERALAVTQRNYRAHDLLGVALEREGRDREAAERFRTALELHPACSDCAVNLAIALGKLGHTAEAKALFEQTLDRRPREENPRSLNGLGALLQREGDLATAERHLLRALELEPEFGEARNNLGVVYAQQGRLAEAQAELEGALRIAPDYALARKNLGDLLQHRGDLDGAAAELARAVELAPGMLEAHFKLATVRAAQGRLAESVRSFERVLELDPDLALAHHNLGLVLQGLGQAERAAAHLARARALDPALAPPPDGGAQ